MKTTSRSLKPLFGLLLTLTAATELFADPSPVIALSGFDPVALTQGTETKGREALQATRGRYRYLFASAENKAKFESAPETYGIQLDGYCMKMGPLSGRGSPERWHVADGRIYLIASESCRNSFKADPPAFTDRADAPPTGTNEEKERGKELVNRALDGFGGADKVDTLKSVRWEAITAYEQEGKKTEMRQATTAVLPDRLRLDYSYGEFREGHALANGRLLEISATDEATQLPDDVYECVRRKLYREPLALLRARSQPGFIAVAAGSGEFQGAKVEWVNVSYAGATSKLAVESNTGRVLSVVYRGRAPSRMGEICKAYSDFKMMEGGLIVPQNSDVTYDGKAPTSPKPASHSVAINVPIESRLFPNSN